MYNVWNGKVGPNTANKTNITMSTKDSHSEAARYYFEGYPDQGDRVFVTKQTYNHFGEDDSDIFSGPKVFIKKKVTKSILTEVASS